LSKLHFDDFCEYGPSDRDAENNFSDTFVKIKIRSLPEWRFAKKALALTAKVSAKTIIWA